MEKIRIAICDDEILLLPQLSAMIKRCFLNYEFQAETDTFSSSAALLEQLYHGVPYEVYFLDIDIPELDGIALAGKIRQKNPEAHLLFISAREERVYESFRVQPLAFVRKSHFSSDIQSAMDTLRNVLHKPEDMQIPFQDELGHTFFLNLTRLIYVEAKEKYQNLVSVDGEQMLRCSIRDLEQTLTAHRFIRIHRSYLVNFQYIYRIDSSSIVLDGGQKLPMSRLRKKEIQQQFLEYARTMPQSGNL